LKGSKINPKQERFVQEYLIDGNATQAAIRAGYSKKTAKNMGHKLVNKKLLSKAILEAQQKRGLKTNITQERVLFELAIIAFSNMPDYLSVDEDTGAVRCKGFNSMPKDASRAIESVKENRSVSEDSKGDRSVIFEKFEFKLHSKIKALELLMQHLGMLGKPGNDKEADNEKVIAALGLIADKMRPE
jgi:phage terminase small subunit